MEATLVIIAILALIGASATLLLRQGSLPWTPTVLRTLGGGTQSAPNREDGMDAVPDPRRDPTPLTPVMGPKPLPIDAPAPQSGTLERVRLDAVQTVSDVVSSRLDRIEARLDELHRSVARQNDQDAEEARRMHAELASMAQAEEARREAAHERLRGDVLAIVYRVMSERHPGVSARRMEVTAELYAQLARLESALATVTNPILLPGEPYAPPAELVPESFVWENWNEVGERAFTLAETYSARRLYLSGQSRADIGAFVTTLRTLLTRSVYPNVQGEPDLAHQAALRAALSEIAAELPKIRELLEMEYQDGRTA